QDYKGQLLAETLYFYIIILFGAVGWVVGFVMGDFTYTVMGWAAGVVVSIILVVPDWPTFNEHPTKWLDQLPSRPGVMPVGAAAEEEENEGEQD
ncbi:unnamed protein product, partial [Ascophyllum nodosum]